MKKSVLSQILSWLLALVLLCATLVGCADTGAGSETTAAPTPDGSTAETASSTEPEETTPTAASVLGERDFDGATVTFYSRYYNGVWRSDLMATSDDVDTLPVAVYRRNKMIEEQYGVRLDEIQSGQATFMSDLERRVKSSDESFDAVYMSATDAANSASAGLLVDLHDVKQIDLDAQWWSQSLNKSWSIGHRQFFAVGDITTIDDMSARGVFFNKDILEQYEMRTPYDYVNKNEWTLENMFTMADTAYIPGSDGAGAQVYGISAQNSFGFIMLMAAGELVSVNNEQDIPEVSIGNERSLAVLDLLTKKTAGNEGIFLGADADVMANFRNGTALFMPEVLYHLISLREADFEVGIVPAPKYNAEQEDYYSFTTGYGITCMGFPQSCSTERLERAAFIVEALSIQSLTTLTPAYFEVCVKTRYAPDLDSSGMIQIIRDTIYTDLAEMYKWGGLRDKVQTAVSQGQNISTIVSGSKKMANIALNLTVDAWAKAPVFNP